jgi:hypothetical protein
MAGFPLKWKAGRGDSPHGRPTNCKHLANATRRARLEKFVRDAGYMYPVICTPEELWED